MCSSPKSSGNTFRVRPIAVNDNYDDYVNALKRASDIFDKKDSKDAEIKSEKTECLHEE